MMLDIFVRWTNDFNSDSVMNNDSAMRYPLSLRLCYQVRDVYRRDIQANRYAHGPRGLLNAALDLGRNPQL
jgi:hypothetical protein